MTRVLLLATVESAEKTRESVRRREGPRREYLELADLFGADVIDSSAMRDHPTARWLARFTVRGAGHAWLASRLIKNYDVVFSDGEHIGLPLAMMLKGRRDRPRHVMIGHRLSSWKKRFLTPLVCDGIDAVIVHSGRQLEHAVQGGGFTPSQVYLTPYSIDTEFWQPQPPGSEQLIVSCGIEQRDYSCLIDAVRDLPISVCVGAMSHWSRDRNRLRGRALPANMTVDAYDYVQLQQLYCQSRMVVVPLRATDFQAGITTILEAMAMGRPVVVTRAPGQQETVVGPLWGADQTRWPTEGPPAEDSTGLYVPVDNADALRAAIVYLLERPELAAVLGANGRRYVEQHTSLGLYVRRLAGVISPDPATLGLIAGSAASASQ